MAKRDAARPAARGAQPVVILSRELWQSAFGSRSLIGQQVQIDGVARTVVGIMPAGFDVHDQHVKIWLPLRLDPAQRKQYRGGHYLYLIANGTHQVFGYRIEPDGSLVLVTTVGGLPPASQGIASR